MLKKLLAAGLLFFSMSVLAYTDNYLCARYSKIIVRHQDKVIDVGIRRILNSSVEIYVLGFGTPIVARFNGRRISNDLINKRRTLQCSGEIVGQIREYDLSFFGDHSGLFKIKSGKLEASTYIEIN
ncbi:MAG: hypothetical protein ACI4NE_00105 [Succinivibrio sp.]